MPINPEDFKDFLKTGAVYVPARLDLAGKQPVIVVDVKKFLDMDLDIPVLEENLKFIFNWVQENMLVPGHVE